MQVQNSAFVCVCACANTHTCVCVCSAKCVFRRYSSVVCMFVLLIDFPGWSMPFKPLKRPLYCWLEHIIPVLVWRSFNVSLLGCVGPRSSQIKLISRHTLKRGWGSEGIETDDNCTVHLFNDRGSSPAGQSHPLCWKSNCRSVSR